jgi:hypothetical protein
MVIRTIVATQKGQARSFVCNSFHDRISTKTTLARLAKRIERRLMGD